MALRGLLTALGPPVTTHKFQEGCLMRTILGSKATLVDLRIDSSEQGLCPFLGVTQRYWSLQSMELILQPSHLKQTQCSRVL